jgi:thioredoxin-dependent peroxiredoxin
MLSEGTSSPAWQSNDQTGALRSSKEFLGSWLLLYFYPKDDTPGCTIEACGLRDSFERLKRRLTVIGVSAESEESHQKFIAKYSLPFTLLADTDRSLIAAFGTDGLLFPKRTTFLIDPEGIIRKVYKGFDCAEHASMIEKDLDALGVMS